MNCHICISGIALAALLASCTQTKSAMDLANKTNAVVLTVSVQLRDFRDTEVRAGSIEAARLGEFLSKTVVIEAACRS